MSNTPKMLTPEKEQIYYDKYVPKWDLIGSDPVSPPKEEVEKIVNDYLKYIVSEKPEEFVEKPIISVKNPLEAWVACCLAEQGVETENLITEIETVFNGNPNKYVIPEAELPYQTGSMFSRVFAFYEFFLEEMEIEKEVEASLLHQYKIWKETVKLGCIYPLDNVTIICDKPAEIHIENGNLHKDGGPAIRYEGHGDFKIYCLNGVTVPEYLAVTPAEQIDLNLYNKEESADVKAEFVRKVGIERFLDKGKKIDSYENYDQENHPWWWKSEYELWDMQTMFSALDYVPFLKMLNQTTGIWHMEAVSPKCSNISEALKERFGGKDFVITDIA